MTPERAAYYRLMLLAGEWEEFERELDFALETEDPITSPILDLALCMSDLNQTVSILHNYTRQTGVDQQQVYDMVMKELRNQYLSGKLDAEGTCKTLEAIKRCCDCDDPWRDLYTYLYEFELLNDGIISQEVFEAGFASVFLRGERLDVWTLEKEHKQKKKSPWDFFGKRKERSIFRD